jgi:hypothetical protein
MAWSCNKRARTTSERILLVSILWGEHPIVRGGQKRQCLYGKEMNRPNPFKPVRQGASKAPKRIGIAADHGGYELKE